MRLTWRALLIAVCCALLLALDPYATVARPGGQGQSDPWAPEHVAAELLVKFRPGQFTSGMVSPALSATFDRYLTAYGVEAATGALLDVPIYRLRFGSADDLRAKQQELLRDPAVEFAEPNYLMTADLTPNDPSYSQQWAVPKTGIDRAWDLTTGGPTIIAMLDTGISPTHPDLAGRLVPGYDFVNNDADPRDDNGHGTFTAGIAGASGNNSTGVAGVSWQTRLMPVKILDKDGRGPVSAFAQAIRFAVDNNAQIVNVSAGIPVPSQTMELAVAYASSKGAVVVAASGNAPDAVLNYPAAYPNVIGVAASTRNDDIADFSSSGSFVTLAAPGVGIISTYYQDGDTYAQLSGTSASAPFIAGTAALMLSVMPKELGAKAVREILKATAVDILTAGIDFKSGYGRLDAYHAVVLARTPAPTLTGATVTPPSGKGSDAFAFNAAGFTPGEPVSVWIAFANGAYRFYRYPSVSADPSGRVLVLLANGEILPAGVHRVTAYGETSRKVAGATLTVTQPATSQAFTRVPPQPDTDSRAYFPQTGHTLSNAFLHYWQTRGGLAIFGYPISEEFVEVSPTDGKPYTVQYFERNRFEYHPENRGTEFEVLLGLLGRDLIAGRSFPMANPPFESSDTSIYFPQTKHSISNDFLTYWQGHGGLAVFGYPLSEPFMEVNAIDGKPYLVQYFERNRFELHPENPPPFNVLLGLLGTDSARMKNYLPR